MNFHYYNKEEIAQYLQIVDIFERQDELKKKTSVSKINIGFFSILCYNAFGSKNKLIK